MDTFFWEKRKNAEKVIKHENSEKVIQKWSEKWSKSEPESGPKSGPKSDPKVIPNRSHSGTGYILHVVVSNWLKESLQILGFQRRYLFSPLFVNGSFEFVIQKNVVDDGNVVIPNWDAHSGNMMSGND